MWRFVSFISILLYGNSISWSFRDEISKPLTNKRLFEPSFPRLFVCLYVRHSAFPLKRWNRPLPSSRTSVIWCRNYDVRTRLSENSSSSVYRTKSRVSENVRKFLEIRRWRLKHYSWERRYLALWWRQSEKKKKKSRSVQLSKKTNQTSRFCRLPRITRETL